MKSSAYLLAILVCLALTVHGLPKKRSPMDSCTELIIVTTSDWNASQGWLRRYARGNIRMPWKAVGEPVPVVVGKTAWHGEEARYALMRKWQNHKIL